MRVKWTKMPPEPTTVGGDALRFRQAGASIVWSPTQRTLLTLWAGLRGGGGLPSWTELATHDLAAQRDTLMSLDVVEGDDGAPRFRITELGKRIVRGHGEDFTGRFLDEAIPLPWRANAIQTYFAALVRERPVYNVVDTLDRQGNLVRLERLLLPFAGPDGDAEHILASIEPSSISGTFDERQIGHTPYADASCVLAVIEL